MRLLIKSDAATLSAADKLKTQSEMPDERQINSSPIADTEAAPKVDSLGNKTIPSEVLRSTHEMTAAALSPEVETSKSTYDQKAKQLSEPNQARLKAYELNTMDALRNVQGDARNHALRNFYEHTPKVMNGTELNLHNQCKTAPPLIIRHMNRNSPTAKILKWNADFFQQKALFSIALNRALF
ncbi:hypothetical protein [Neisseria gonorrhoeae]|uniref:hypothetical protein n=1 Tax=Neisseria gonorrhoeae TaxID=485 RepID=UPI000E0197D0|nr:hypothetical protein [Neisseria gonorrhoeae]STZ91423.1 Uncharacterised protein [Neisseria gonorrhoeae]